MARVGECEYCLGGVFLNHGDTATRRVTVKNYNCDPPCRCVSVVQKKSEQKHLISA